MGTAKVLALLISLLVLTGTANAQTGSASGGVYDEESGEEIIGANVVVVGTKFGDATDLDGKYLINGLAPGTYDIRFSYAGYAAKVVTGVIVSADQPTRVDVTLASMTYEGEEVVVTAERILVTEAALLSERKKAATIGDGISAEQVKRTPDATSGDALRRVTGISVVDNKFVYIRGVTDRYNGTLLNGVAVTTTDTDVDKKSFAFDMVPANLLDNLIVTKTATPDLPGDFTGGIVQLNTLDFPGSRVAKLGLSTSYNSITNLQAIQKSQGGRRDWMGFDDGTRAYPGPGLDGYQLGKKLPNTWAQRSDRGPLNGGLSLSLGDAMELNEDLQFGYVGALSYRNGYQRTETESHYFRTGSRILESSGTRDQYTVLWGGILDMTVKLSELHKLSFKNNFNQVGEDRLTRISGVDENEQFFKAQVTEWDQRSLYVGKISGEHAFPALSGLQMLWQGAYVSSIAKEPDRKTAIYSKNIYYPESYPFAKALTDRSWSDLNEYTRNAAVDFVLPVGSLKMKLGAQIESKKRDYRIEFFVAELDRNSTAFDLLVLPIDSAFLPENFGPGKFVMSRLDDPRDRYTAEQTLYAGYMMFDIPFSVLTENFRFVGGARMENSEHLVNTISPFETNAPYVARLKKIDVFPSLNLTYLLNGFANLRFAYSQSVNRPEFREMASFYFYDYSIYEGVYGNPLLQRALSKNYDVRLEAFPGIGEVIALSYFYKDISGAIEQQIIISSNPERTWFNSPHGRNYGWELEVRKNLGFLCGYLENFSITGNYTRVFSEIKYPLFYGSTEYGLREMQGQSPYMINISFLFTEPSFGTTVNVLYNQFGRRLDAVGDQRPLDVFEEPHGVLDASITQPVYTGLEVKFTVRDWGARAKKFATREGNPYRTQFQGTTYSLQASLAL